MKTLTEYTTPSSISQEAAHDLRNMLCVLTGRIKILERILENSSLAAEECASIEHQTHCMRRAIDQATELCNEGMKGTCTGERREEDLTDIIHSCCDMISPLLGSHIELNIELKHTVQFIPCNIFLLNRAVLNIMKNAMESMSEHGGVLTVSTGETWVHEDEIQSFIYDGVRHSGAYVYIDIHDQGCGMDVQAFRKKPYSFSSINGEGHGYGLKSTIRILKRLDGLMHIHSRAGEGTTMRVLLSCKTEDSYLMPEQELKQGVGTQVEGIIKDIYRQSHLNPGQKKHSSDGKK